MKLIFTTAILVASCLLERVFAEDSGLRREELYFVDHLKGFNVGQLEEMRQLLQKDPENTFMSDEQKAAIRDMNSYEENGGRAERMRMLQTDNVIEAFKNPVVSEAWTRVRAPYTSSNSIERTSPMGGKDKIKVEKIGSKCYLTAQESNEASDWWENLSSGRLDIASSDAAGNSIGGGHPGFVGPYNDLRLGIMDLMDSICSGTSENVYVGYSRGGAIMLVTLYAHLKAGITTGSTSTLVTFGAPRSLLETEANFVHDALGSRGHRVMNKKDPVPSVPPGWFGWPHGSYYTHVGSNSYGVNRNGPTFMSNWNFAQHTQYDPSFAASQSEGETMIIETSTLIVGVVGGTLIVIASALVVISYKRARSAEKMLEHFKQYIESDPVASRRFSSKMSVVSYNPRRARSAISTASTNMSKYEEEEV